MKRHKFTKWNKEKISVYASAALVVCVCVVSGIYAGSQSPSKKQIIDIESVEDDGIASADEGQSKVNENAQALSQVEDTVTVTASNGQPSIPTDAAQGMEQAAKLTEETVLTADLTGDAEISDTEIVDAEDADFSVPTMAESGSSREAALHFNAEDGLSWPVIGNVVMNYSMDERIYFATLNQYCYYPAVAISAQEGQAVNAAAPGTVVKIGVNEEIGQYMVMDLGDGYQATYGQLQELTVEQGDRVSKGQIIGYVASPTKYYSLEGTNLYFKLEQNEESIDPVAYFR